jgi:hypothetical protein
MLISICNFGGLLFFLTVIHLIVDWGFQSHDEALLKHNTSSIRAKHCVIYTVGFYVLLILLGCSFWQWISISAILFITHFIEDTYYLPYLWAKYIRQPREMLFDDNKIGFEDFIKTPFGHLLIITIDQIIHVVCLVPVALILLR